MPSSVDPPKPPVRRVPAARSVSPLARLALGAALAAASGLGHAGAAPASGAGPIKIGMSAAFTGSSAGLGIEYYRGAKAYFDEVNARGGVRGRRLELVALDDGYQPDRTVANTVRLIGQERVFTLFNYVGTPTLTAALPVLKSFEGQKVSLIGNLTGAQIQRNLPYSGNVFNIRASYAQEMEAQVEQLWAAGFRKFGVFYQLDAFGRSGEEGVARALARHGARITAEATYRRGVTADADMGPAMKHLRDAGVEVVLSATTYEAGSAFIRAARDGGWNVPITNLSGVSADNMLDLLREAGRKSGRDYTRGLYNTQVVPSYNDARFPAVGEYRRLIDKWKPTLPAGVQNPGYRPVAYSFLGLEGFLNAKVVVEGLRAAGPTLTRAGFRSALEDLTELDLGIGEPLTFSPIQHQGLNRVYLTAVQGGRWVTVNRWQLRPGQ